MEGEGALNYTLASYGLQSAKEPYFSGFHECEDGEGGDFEDDSCVDGGVGQVIIEGLNDDALLTFSGVAFNFESELRALFPNPLTIDWTGVLQWIRSLPSLSSFLQAEKQAIFEKFGDLFVAEGLGFAKLLIDQSFLPNEQRSVKPDRAFGGFAGGTKYRKGMQLFKFARDVKLDGGRWLYGGQSRNEASAMKSAGHELKSTQALIDATAHLNTAMMAVFTYRGRRVTCVSLLPVRGAQTLVQGKSHWRNKITRPSPAVEAVMMSAAASLNLAKNPEEGVYGPFDMEVHLQKGLLFPD